VTRSARRRLYLTGAILLVVALVGGRWLAVETAERAWDRTFTGGTTLVDARNLGLILQAFVLVFAITWATGNLLIVYRAIGSVQMPRRLGDLEIVEAVSHRVLFGGTLLLGLVLGVLFSLGTGDWWRYAALASSPPHFGIADNRIGLDAGYYVGRLPWLSALQNRALVLAFGMLAIVVLLYSVIGSLRLRRGRVRASNHARAHCGILLAVLALVITWGAVLDPAEVIAGVHGIVDQAALSVRIPGASVVAAVSILTAVISLAWAWRDRPTLIIAGWVALVVSIAVGYFVIPGVVRASSSEAPETSDIVRHRAEFERVAFGLTGIEERLPPAFASGETAVRSLPVWDAVHVALAANAPITGVTLRPTKAGESATWLLAPTNMRAPLRLALETDTGLAIAPLPTSDAASAPLFGPGVAGPLIASSDSTAGARARGIPISGAWRRFAIAWTIQDWSVLRAEMKDRALLWRRDVTERLERLAPFASFGSPIPVLRGGNLWWVSWGYVSHDAFPYTRPLPKDDDMVRYLRAGLLGAVSVGTGETHLWLVPGYDSLTAAWARRFEPLIERAENLPPDLRTQAGYPATAFETIVAQLQRSSNDSASWAPRPRQPYQVAAPTGELWTAVAFEQGSLGGGPRRFVGLCAGAMTARGLELYFWKPAATESERLPGELVGSTMLRPGQLRIWPAENTVLTVQAQIVDPIGAHPTPPPRIAEVYVSLDGRSGRGPTARAALHGGEVIVTDTSVAARWERARRLAVRADSALTAGDLELFGKLWRALMGELAPAPRPR
jgi:hypothetical protein